MKPDERTRLCEQIGERVARLRSDFGWKQDELAYAAGVGTAAISRLERGAVDLPISHLVDIAHALEVGVADLLEFEPREYDRSQKRRRALAHLNAMLYQRQASDVVAVVKIVDQIFGITQRRKRAPAKHAGRTED